MEIKEIIGQTWDGDNTTISYPSGYDANNIRVLSYEINDPTTWTGEFHYKVVSAGIRIYYEDSPQYHYRLVRIIAMKMP
ncbi:hypothetical protein ACFLZA_02605 [Candidatus Neomarinimicrobiota bacterium]